MLRTEATRNTRLIPSHKELIVPPSLLGTSYRIPRLTRGAVVPAAAAFCPPTFQAVSLAAAEGDDRSPSVDSTQGRHPKDSRSESDARRDDSPSSIGRRAPSPLRTTPAEREMEASTLATLEHLVRCQRVSPRIERLRQSTQQRVVSPRKDNGQSPTATGLPDTKGLGWRQNASPPHRSYKNRQMASSSDWLMSARQREVSAHNSVRWKSASEAYVQVGRSPMHVVRDGAASQRVSPRPGAGGSDRLTRNGDDLIMRRLTRAALGERRRESAARIRARIKSLSPTRRAASPVTRQEKASFHSESAKWFGAGTAVVFSTVQRPVTENSVPGPGAYRLPKTFGAGYTHSDEA